MRFELVNIIQVAIASPAILTALLLAPRRNMRALSGLLAVFGVHMIFNVVEETGLASSDLLVTPALSLLYGPLFYLLIRDIIFHNRSLGRGDLIHFAPLPLGLLLIPWLGVVRIATIVSLAAYAAACIRNIWIYHSATQTQRSDAAALRLNWVIAVFFGFGALTVIDVVRLFTGEFQPAGFDQAAYALSLLAVALLFGVLAFFAINRPRYFSGLTDEEFRFSDGRAAVGGEATNDDVNSFSAIAATIDSEQLHRRPHLTLYDLANHTDKSERELSRLINSVGKRNFCDYINALRVKDACRMLAADNTAQRTILDLAFEAGFTSKSTFNSVFKKETGVTPSEYRRRVVQNRQISD